jgi:hypothetical protein
MVPYDACIGNAIVDSDLDDHRLAVAWGLVVLLDKIHDRDGQVKWSLGWVYAIVRQRDILHSAGCHVGFTHSLDLLDTLGSAHVIKDAVQVV